MPLPTKVYCQSFQINGVELARHVNMGQAFENICKPYLTAIITVIDNVDIIASLNLQGAEPASFIFVADGGQSYSGSDFQVFSIKGNRSNYSLRTMIYEIELIGTQYFGDKRNLVQQSFKNITGTGIISQVHSQYVGGSLSIPVQSTGLLGQGNPIIARSSKPFKFIDDIRRQLTFGQYQTGASVYYHDKFGVNLAPLEYLMSSLSPQASFIQKATWGASWQDIFNSQNAIITAATITDPKNPGGFANMKDIASAATQEKKVIDIYSHKRIFNDMAQNIISSVPGLAGGTGGGGHGGRQNYYFVDTQKFPKENIRQTDKESAYQASITAGQQVIIKVPCQTGFLCTVGKGFSATLVPPAGDNTQGSENTNSYLAIRIEHTLHCDDNQLAGTSTIHGVIQQQ